MKKLILFLFLGGLFIQCSPKTASTKEETAQNTPDATVQEDNSGQNTLTAEEKAAGWKLLFDGKTMDGWRNFKSQSIQEGWSISDGAIMLTPGKKGGDLITNDTYENYELSVDWKIAECGNSGIIFNVLEKDKYGAVWHTGPEMQVLDNTCHPDAKIITHRAGDLYDMISCSEETVLPAGQWNTAKIHIDNGKTEFWLNGKKVVAFEMFTEEWKKMIAESKFKTKPDFGTARKGHIALQDHSDQVWYRNIKIREL